jgi:hypothetical protein
LRALVSKFFADAVVIGNRKFVPRRSEDVGLWPSLCENSKSRRATRMIFSGSIKKLNALAVWAPKAALNE